MSNDQFILLIVYSGDSSGEAALTSSIARQPACVYVAGISFSRAIRGAQQTGPPKNPAGLGNDLFVIPMGPKRDLFGMPFGPHFPIRTGAKYANLPDFRRNPVRGTEVCTKRNVARQTEAWRRPATPNCGEAFSTVRLSKREEAASGALFMVLAPVLRRCAAGERAPASSQQRVTARTAVWSCPSLHPGSRCLHSASFGDWFSQVSKLSFLLDQLAELFDAEVKTRGREYQRRGSVRVLSADSDGIRAKVYGTDTHQVSVRLPTVEEPEFSCTCDDFARDERLCAHVWAVLLQADGNSQLTEEWDDDQFDDEVSVDGKLRAFGIQDTRKESTPRWKKLIGTVKSYSAQKGHHAVPWPANTRLAYLLSVDRGRFNEAGLVVELTTQKLGKNGRWDKPKQARFREGQLGNPPDLADRVIVQMLRGCVDADGYSRGDSARRFLVPEAAYDTTLKAIAETGRCMFRRADPNEPLIPLKWDDGPPWVFHLKLNGDDPERNYRLEGWLHRGEARVPIGEVNLPVQGGLVFMKGSIARLDDSGAWAMLIELHNESREVVVSRQDGLALVKALTTLPSLPPTEWPEDLQITHVHAEPQPILRLRKFDGMFQSGSENRLVGELYFDYQGQSTSAKQTKACVFSEADRTLLLRDIRKEQAAIRRLAELGFKNEWDDTARTALPTIPSAKLPGIVPILLAEHWLIEAEGKLYRRPGKMKMEVSSGIDWFELTAEMDFEGETVSMPRLLTALRRGENMIKLGDGSMGLLPEEWLKRYAPLIAVAEETDDALRFTQSQVGFLDLLIAQMPEATMDEAFRQARRELARFDGVNVAEAPAGFVGELRPYQKEGLGWLGFLRKFSLGGCLADDMGLGKTIQVLAMLEGQRQAGAGASLVVVPRSLVFNWIQEAARFTPQLRVLDQSTPDRLRQTKHFQDYDLVVTTYGTLRQDIAYFKDFNFDYAILDESQAIKNSSTASSKAVRLLQSHHRLAMSGTPIENHLGELWSLLEFLNPGMLGSSNVFAQLAGNAQLYDAEGRKLLAQALRPFILRRSKSQVARDLPDKTEQTIYCELEPEQRKMYTELKEHYRQSLFGMIDSVGIGKSKIHILEALLRLRQAACHPGLIDPERQDDPSAKIDTLIEQVAEVMEEGHKVLVFSQFTSLLALLKRRLDAQKVTYEYLDGKTRDRQERVTRFQNDETCKLFLISLKAGGTGLNLTAADYVFLLDPWWNPAVEAQAIDRAHRIGQTRSVFAYRLIAKDTVEEKVLQLQQTKRELAEAILTADNGVITGLKREDLELLLS